jgi:pilus assembly protein CpaB
VASGVSGFLRPGDRVDVYWTGRVDSRDPNMPRGEVTKMILAGMRLIAIDQNSEADTSGTSIARTVTVAATREQTLVLTHAQSTGQLTLSLISQDEDGEAITTEVDQLSMLGLQRAEPVAAPEPVQREQVCSTRVRRGAEVVNIPIPCTN